MKYLTEQHAAAQVGADLFKYKTYCSNNNLWPLEPSYEQCLEWAELVGNSGEMWLAVCWCEVAKSRIIGNPIKFQFSQYIDDLRFLAEQRTQDVRSY